MAFRADGCGKRHRVNSSMRSRVDRHSATEQVVRMRNELERHTMHLVATYSSNTYTTGPRRNTPPLTSSFPTPADGSEGLQQSGRSSQAVPLSSSPLASEAASSPPFFSLSSGPFSPECPTQASTQPSEQPSLASPPLRCTIQICQFWITG